MGNRSILSGYRTPVGKSVLTIRIERAANNSGDVRGFEISGLLVNISSGGLHALNIEASTPALVNHEIYLHDMGVAVPDDAAGVAIRIAGGVRSQLHTLERINVADTVWLDGVADAVVLRDLKIGGRKVGIIVDAVEGAFNTQISGGAIVTRDGAIWIKNGSQVFIDNVQMEQAGVNASPHKCHILIHPQDHPSLRGKISRCNFGAGTNLATSIKMVGSKQPVENWIIDGSNTFNIAGPAGRGPDIEIADAAVKYTQVGPSPRLRGDRGDPAGDLDDLLRLADAGVGAYGVWKGASDFRFANGWTGPTFRFRKTDDGLLICEGELTPGRLVEGAQIGTFPLGFRPRQAVLLSGYTGRGPVMLRIGSDGVVTLGAGLAAGPVNMGAAQFRVKGRTSYDPGA